MQRALRFALIGVLCLVLLAVAAAGLAVLLIKPNDYKPQLIAAVKKATGRTLSLPGDLSLSVFPGISVSAGPAELTDDAAFGPEPFFRVQKMKADLALFPLLSGSVRIGEIALEGVRVKLAVTQTGRVNWDMKAPGGPGGAGPDADAVTSTPLREGAAPAKPAALPDIGIADLSLKDAAVSYRDLGSGEAYSVTVSSFRLEDFASGQKSSFSLRAVFSDERAKKSAALDLKGSLHLAPALDKPTALSFSGSLDKAALAGDLTFALREAAGVPAPMLKGGLKLGALDLDRYLPASGPQAGSAPQKSAQARKADAAKSAEDEEKTLKILRVMDIDLALTAESLTVSKLPLRSIQATLRAEQGRISVAPCSLSVAEGLLKLEAKADARGKALQAASNGTLRGLKVGALLKSLAGKESITGDLDLSWDVNGGGLAWPVLSRSLEGKADLSMTKGLLTGFQIIPEGITGVAGVRQDIVIASLTGTWRITKGVANSNDILLQGPAVNAKAAGRFDIPSQAMDYRVTVSLPALPEVPARVSGPLASPSYTVDAAGLLRNTAKGVLQSPGKAGEGLGRGLKELFK